MRRIIEPDILNVFDAYDEDSPYYDKASPPPERRIKTLLEGRRTRFFQFMFEFRLAKPKSFNKGSGKFSIPDLQNSIIQDAFGGDIKEREREGLTWDWERGNERISVKSIQKDRPLFSPPRPHMIELVNTKTKTKLNNNFDLLLVLLTPSSCPAESRGYSFYLFEYSKVKAHISNSRKYCSLKDGKPRCDENGFNEDAGQIQYYPENEDECFYRADMTQEEFDLIRPIYKQQQPNNCEQNAVVDDFLARMNKKLRDNVREKPGWV